MSNLQPGDLVHVTANLDASMRHFPSNCNAIVIGSYAQQFGGADTDSLTLFIQGSGETSWYSASRLTLIERGRQDLLEQWRKELEEDKKQKGDLDWIFTHGKELLTTECPGASIEALAECLGIDNLWGERGEGFVYMSNALLLLEFAAPYLKRGDKDRWLEMCRRVRTG